jgi:hypothetical protein
MSRETQCQRFFAKAPNTIAEGIVLQVMALEAGKQILIPQRL